MINQIPSDIQESQKLKELMINLSSGEDILEELMVLGDRPEVLSLLVYKLSQEREKTNAILKEINDKYNKLYEVVMQTQKNQDYKKEKLVNIDFLSEQDKNILDLARKFKKITANDVKESLKYKGLNAASQRLNKLVKEGILLKKRVGQKVYFYIN